ncbi:MAG: formyl transferase [Bdellovibrionales bacterium CG10_big_fil_rev_8_21_14_0_10_45_34]|nr:MAG: formyl transferase [Bdellovibrionales bacterium CG10_big_fil_rev_8_21_14_0_10_45_34]
MAHPLRVVVLGCVEFSLAMAQAIRDSQYAEIVGIISKNESNFNSDFVSLKGFADQNDIDYLNWTNPSECVSSWVLERGVDLIFCVGWSNILRTEFLRSPKLGVIGYHPAMLPKHRGRHPVIWSLVLGLDSTGSTFFWMDEGADSGDVISQEVVPIKDSDYAADLYQNLVTSSALQIGKMLQELSLGDLKSFPQDGEQATYWRKRRREDGIIDWRMSARSIRNLVRGLSNPYVGASAFYNGEEYKIWRSDIVVCSETGIEPGMVTDLDGTEFVVQTGENRLRVVDHSLKNLPRLGEYI